MLSGRAATVQRPRAIALVGACMLVLAACSTGPGATQGPGSTVEMAADYVVYDKRSLVDAATLVVEGTALSAESTVLMPTFDGDTPEENPLLGLSDDEKKDAVESASGLPVTVVTFAVDVVHRGTPRTGDEIAIVQIGGVDLAQTSEVPLEVGQRYLLFATDDLDGAHAILGGSGGTYADAGDGTFVAVKPDMAPFDSLTGAEVAALTG